MARAGFEPVIPSEHQQTLALDRYATEIGTVSSFTALTFIKTYSYDCIRNPESNPCLCR